MFKAPKPFLVVLLVLVAFVALAQNTVVEQATDILLRNSSTNSVALKVVKPATLQVPYITLGTQTSTVFSVGATGLVTAVAYAGDGSQLTGISGGGGGNFDPLRFATNASSQVTVNTNNFHITSRIEIETDGVDTNWTIFEGSADFVVGFIRVKGEKSISESCDVLLHVDGIPFSGTVPAICQFQGALAGTAFWLQISTDTEGTAKMTFNQDQSGWTYTIEGYGDSMPTLSVTDTNDPAVLNSEFASPQFAPIHGQISANQLIAGTLLVRRTDGSTTPVATFADNMLQIGDVSFDTKIMSTLSVLGVITNATTIEGDGTATGAVKINGVKVYRAILTQTGTSAPTATVLENSLGGTVVWTREGAGDYDATLSGAFTADKTLCFIGNKNFNTITSARRTDANIITVTTSGEMTQTDEVLTGTAIEILVYP